MQVFWALGTSLSSSPYLDHKNKSTLFPFHNIQIFSWTSNKDGYFSPSIWILHYWLQHSACHEGGRTLIVYGSVPDKCVLVDKARIKGYFQST